MTLISTTKDPAIAARVNRLRGSTGEEHRGHHPVDPLTAPGALRYPFHGESKDGPCIVRGRLGNALGCRMEGEVKESVASCGAGRTS